MTNEEAVGLIRGKVSRDHLLCQLAEEASELSQAALKLRRCVVPGNPARISEKEAETELMEETADVLLLLNILRLTDKKGIISIINRKKLKRWVESLGCRK